MKTYLQEGMARLGIASQNEEMVEKQLRLLEELLRWNKKINLTAIDDLKDAVEKHLIDSLVPAALFNEGKWVADIGSGAGLPVLPLAIARPDVNFLSIECVGKKVHFQNHIKRTLKLNNIRIIKARVEEIDQLAGEKIACDYVIARGLAALEKLAIMAHGILVKGGHLVAMKGSEIHEELQRARPEFDRLYEQEQMTIRSYALPYSGAKRHLILIKKKEEANKG